MGKKISTGYMELVKKKKALFECYRFNTLQLKEALTNSSLSDVQSCIAQREQVVKQINQIDKKLEFAGKDDPKKSDITDRHTDENVNIFFKDMELIISEISALENDCKNLAATERDLLKNELLGYQQGKRGTKGYQTGNAAPAKFIDTTIW